MQKKYFPGLIFISAVAQCCAALIDLPYSLPQKLPAAVFFIPGRLQFRKFGQAAVQILSQTIYGCLKPGSKPSVAEIQPGPAKGRTGLHPLLPVGNPQRFHPVKQFPHLFRVFSKGLPVPVFIVLMQPFPQSGFQLQGLGQKERNQ